MFSFCRKITSLNVEHFDINKLKDMIQMLNNCNELQYLNINNYKIGDKTNSKEGLAAKFINKEKEEKNSPDNLLDIKYVKNEVAKDDKKFNENFELLKSLKAGGSGVVYIWKLKKNRKDIAIKIINKQNVNNKEVSIHSKLRHHKIPAFYGYHPFGKNHSFIAMEYNKFGDLENFKRNINFETHKVNDMAYFFYLFFQNFEL